LPGGLVRIEPSSARTLKRPSTMADIKSPSLLIAKGLLFLLLACATAYLVWAELPTVRTALLLALLAWSASRFYYFLFYVLERYVDSSLRYAGIWNLVAAIARRRRR
jgi:hypothetical protein